MKIETKIGLELIVDKKLEDSVNLYTTKPFDYEGLNVDCSSCVYFATQPIFFPSGKCCKYSVCCGVGNACENYIKR